MWSFPSPLAAVTGTIDWFGHGFRCSVFSFGAEISLKVNQPSFTEKLDGTMHIAMAVVYRLLSGLPCVVYRRKMQRY